jgi:hypothetical protein
MLKFVIQAPLQVVLESWISGLLHTIPGTRYCCSPEGKNEARCAGLCSVAWFCTNRTIPVLVVLVSIIRISMVQLYLIPNAFGTVQPYSTCTRARGTS